MAIVAAGCPDKVWVGTLEFGIAFVPLGHKAITEDGDGNPCDQNGCTEFEPPVISVCDVLSRTKMLEILWHELTHAVNYVAEIEDGVAEEDIADRHARVWSQFWIDNPRFQRWWTKACVAVRRDRAGRKR